VALVFIFIYFCLDVREEGEMVGIWEGGSR
jgi:hypothetical protein